MIKKDNDLLGSLLHDVAHLIRLEIDSRLEKYNLTRVKWLALGIIQKKGGLTQADLAAELELGSAAVGRLVDRLVDRAFIERKPAPNDRRAYQLFLKPGVEALLVELEATGDSIREKALEGVSKQETEFVSTVLAKIRKNLKFILIVMETSMAEFQAEFLFSLIEWPYASFAFV